MGLLNSRRGLLNAWQAAGRLGTKYAGFTPSGAASPEPPAPSPSSNRITATGDRRITATSDVRITN